MGAPSSALSPYGSSSSAITLISRVCAFTVRVRVTRQSGAGLACNRTVKTTSGPLTVSVSAAGGKPSWPSCSSVIGNSFDYIGSENCSRD